MCLNQNLYPVKLLDDTTVFKVAHRIPVTMQDIGFFSKASRLYINVEQNALLAVHEFTENVIKL